MGNAGWAFTDATRSATQQNTEFAANGIFFDNYKNTIVGPTDGREAQQRISMRMANIQDGTSKTLLFSESLHTLLWTYESPDNSNITDTKHLFGFVWSNVQTGTGSPIGQINKGRFDPKAATMEEWADLSQEKYGYPSSRHAGGVNFSFCDSHVDFISETIDPKVYAQLMTSNSRRSYLVWGNPAVPDSKLSQPSDSEY